MSLFISGVPGTGKTAYAVAAIKQLLKLNPHRVLYQHGVRELQIKHTPVFCRSETCLSCKSVTFDDSTMFVDDWFKWSKPNDIILIDECQRVWAPRHASSKRPDSVAMMETHRHLGVELILITQHPKLVDGDIRVHMRKHIHLTAGWAGRNIYEWDTVSNNLKFTEARKQTYKLDKLIFEAYKSSDEHIEIKRTKPKALYILAASFPLLIIISYVFYNRLQDRINPETVTIEEGVDYAGERPHKSTSDNIPLPDFTPRQPGKLETAPAYDNVLKVTDVPLLAGCISSKTKCYCYTRQGSPYPMEYNDCRTIVKTTQFNPYQKLIRSETNHKIASTETEISQ